MIVWLPLKSSTSSIYIFSSLSLDTLLIEEKLFVTVRSTPGFVNQENEARVLKKYTTLYEMNELVDDCLIGANAR